MDPRDYFDMTNGTTEIIGEEGEKKETLDDQFARERLEWSTKVENMGFQMKKVTNIPELMTEVYTERQLCVEYYHYLISVLIKLNRKYKKEYADKYDYWSFKSQIRYPNESAKNNKIQTELADSLIQRETVENHSKYIDKTISTIDNIIYAIPKRIELEQISRGK